MRETVRSDYGNRLLQARVHAKLTQTRLSKDVGMSQSTYAEVERSSRSRGSMYTAQIAARCGVRAEWLAAGTGPMLENGTQETSTDADAIAGALMVIAKALEKSDKNTRSSVIHSISLLENDPLDVPNITQIVLAALKKGKTGDSGGRMKGPKQWAVDLEEASGLEPNEQRDQSEKMGGKKH